MSRRWAYFVCAIVFTLNGFWAVSNPEWQFWLRFGAPFTGGLWASLAAQEFVNRR